MANKKLLTITGLLTTIGTVGVIGLSTVSAETNDTSVDNTMSSLVDKIAEKFSLKEEDVQAVFDEHRDDMEEEHQARLEDRLSEAVSDDRITEDQKSKILAKLEELKAQREENREGFQDMTEEERREAMEQHREELEAWAEENDIPEEYLYFHLSRGVGHKFNIKN